MANHITPPENCTGCGKCVPVCPNHALQISGHQLLIDRTKCTGCGICVNVCWPGALELLGTRRTADHVFEECARDIEFYKQSGGGVTLSGGEPLLQAL